MSARMQLDSGREALLVELAGIGADGLRALTSSDREPDPDTLAAELELALDETLSRWTETAAEEHAAVGRFAAESGVEHLVAIGEHAALVTRAAVAAGLPPSRAVRVTAKADAVAVVTSDLGPGDVVLVKASRGLALDTVADEILTAVGPPSDQDAV